MISIPALEELREAFMQSCPDFESYRHETGVYWSQERAYKEALIGRTRQLLDEYNDGQNAELGAAVLDLLLGETEGNGDLRACLPWEGHHQDGGGSRPAARVGPCGEYPSRLLQWQGDPERGRA